MVGVEGGKGDGRGDTVLMNELDGGGGVERRVCLQIYIYAKVG